METFDKIVTVISTVYTYMLYDFITDVLNITDSFALDNTYDYFLFF